MQRMGPTPPQLLQEFAAAAAPAAPAAGPSRRQRAARRSAAAAPAAASAAALQEQVAAAVSSILGTEVQPDAPLMSSGLDSLGSVELRNSLEAALGLQLPPTLVFDYPSTAAIAGFIAARVESLTADEADADSDGFSDQDLDLSDSSNAEIYSGPAGLPSGLAKGSTRAAAGALLAVSSVVFRAARDVWAEGFAGDATVATPAERWDVDCGPAADLFTGAPVRFGVYLPGAADFDAPAFGISGPEAALMDPQQRLLLECAAEATSAASGGLGRCGVFVGVSSMDYGKMAARYVKGVTAYSATGKCVCVWGGLLSLGRGAAVDLACMLM
jgi:acyl carrier protein